MRPSSVREHTNQKVLESRDLWKKREENVFKRKVGKGLLPLVTEGEGG